MDQTHSSWGNPFGSITPFEDQARLRNFLATNDHNIFRGNYFVNRNDIRHRYSTTPPVQDLKTELHHRLTLSSPANSTNTDHRTRGHNFFERRIDQYPRTENDTDQSSSIDIELDNIPVGPRNDHRYRNRRQEGRTRMNKLDDNAMLRLIERGNLSETQIIYLTNVHLHELMVDRVGNGFVQSLLRTCNDSLINQLLLSLVRKRDLFVAVCLDDLGHRAVVKLMDRLRFCNQQATIALEISAHVVSLAKSPYGGHEVLKRCFQSLSREANELILLRIAQNCLEIVRDKAGCCILQECIKYALKEVREALISPLIQNAENLSKHPYGNYTLQYMIHLDGANIGSRIIQELKNSFVELSLDKHGSNVVEKCMSCCEGGANKIIFEIMKNDQNLLQVCANEYGNYVVQRAVSLSKRKINSLLLRALEDHWFVLRFHPYGKNVIAAVERVSKKSKALAF